ncbi:MAG: alpha/beta fold hydrolase [Deltaproteobacteria bacterium]|nr:alpha/beta fold hydrolase [Deltaproteobacteria bacterium]
MRRRPFASIVCSLLCGLALGASLSSCYFTRSPSRPIPALAFRNPRLESPRCLVVFLPGFLDTPDTYLDNDFPQELIRSGAPCDMVGVDLHFRYYGQVGVADMIYEDVLQPAAARGYDEIWLVGISMGGLGTLLTASRYPEEIDGIVLIAPFVGEESVLREIEAAGGARAWSPPEGLASEPWSDRNYTQKIWSWLRGYHTDPDARPPLYIGWGVDDRLGAADRLLADLMPADHVVSEPGGHAWVTWRPIWRQMVTRVPLGRISAPPVE